MLQFQANSAGSSCIGDHGRIIDPIQSGFGQHKVGRPRRMGDSSSRGCLVSIERNTAAAVGCCLRSCVSGIQGTNRWCNTGRPLWAGGANRTFSAGGTGRSLRTGGANRTFSAGGTGRSLRTGGADRAFSAGGAGRPLWSSWADRAFSAGGAGRSLRTGGANRTFSAGGAGRPLRTGGTDRAFSAGGTGRPLRTGGADRAFSAGGAGRPLWTGNADQMIVSRATRCSGRILYSCLIKGAVIKQHRSPWIRDSRGVGGYSFQASSSRADGPCGTSGTNCALGPRRTDWPGWPWEPHLALNPLKSLRTLRTLGPCGPCGPATP